METKLNQSNMSGRPMYVVGVDGSLASVAAARWAADRAARDGAKLHVVHAYFVEAIPSVAGAIRTPGMRRLALRDAKRLLHTVVEQLPADRVSESVAIEGAADRVLLEYSRAADLLVLGARPQHRVPHARFIGSTAAHCLRGSACPVVMVPGIHPEPAGIPTRVEVGAMAEL